MQSSFCMCSMHMGTFFCCFCLVPVYLCTCMFAFLQYLHCTIGNWIWHASDTWCRLSLHWTNSSPAWMVLWLENLDVPWWWSRPQTDQRTETWHVAAVYLACTIEVDAVALCFMTLFVRPWRKYKKIGSLRDHGMSGKPPLFQCTIIDVFSRFIHVTWVRFISINVHIFPYQGIPKSDCRVFWNSVAILGFQMFHLLPQVLDEALLRPGRFDRVVQAQRLNVLNQLLTHS